MNNSTETLEFIENTRKKACALYANDKIASPLIKTIDLVERIVNGEAHDSELKDDVRRLVDDADYTRQRDGNRDDPLRSIVIDMCKMFGFATRAIASTSEREETAKETVNVDEAANKSTNELAHIPKEEPPSFHPLSTTPREEAEGQGFIANSGVQQPTEHQHRIFSDSNVYSNAADDQGIMKPNLDFGLFDTNLVKNEFDEGLMGPSNAYLDEAEELPAKRRRASTHDFSYDEGQEAEEEDFKEEHRPTGGKKRKQAKAAEQSLSTSSTPLSARSRKSARGMRRSSPKSTGDGQFPCSLCHRKYTSQNGLFTHNYEHYQGNCPKYLSDEDVARIALLNKSELHFSRILFDEVQLPTEFGLRVEERDQSRVDFVFECIRRFKEPDPEKIISTFKYCVRKYNYNLTRRAIYKKD